MRSGVVWPVGALLGCVLLVLLTAALGPVTFSADSPLERIAPRPGAVGVEAPQEAAADQVTDTLDPPEPLLGIPGEVVVAMALAIVAGAVLVGSLRRAGGQAGAQDDEDPQEGPDGDGVDLVAVAAAARRGLARLDAGAGGEAADVVVACWVELEDAGTGVGGGPRAVDTPSDFAARLHAAVPGLDPAALDDLRSTYSRARYGRHDGAGVTEADVERARAALAGLLTALPGDAAVPR